MRNLMNILVTGSEGFVGKNLCKKLKRKHKIIKLDRKLGHDLLTCDLNYDVDLVIHLAGSSGVRESLLNERKYVENNVMVSTRLFKHFKKTKIIYASSSTAKEPDLNPYAWSKRQIEKIAPKNSIGLRFTTIYGPHARENMLIPKLINKEVIYINKNHSRDFIHVDDVISAIELLINSSYEISGVYDLGYGESYKLTDLAREFASNVTMAMGDIHERLDNKADNDLFYALGWKPKVNLYDYIKETISHR